MINGGRKGRDLFTEGLWPPRPRSTQQHPLKREPIPLTTLFPKSTTILMERSVPQGSTLSLRWLELRYQHLADSKGVSILWVGLWASARPPCILYIIQRVGPGFFPCPFTLSGMGRKKLKPQWPPPKEVSPQWLLELAGSSWFSSDWSRSSKSSPSASVSRSELGALRTPLVALRGGRPEGPGWEAPDRASWIMPCETRLARLLVRLDPAGRAPSKSSGSAASSRLAGGPWDSPAPGGDRYIKLGIPMLVSSSSSRPVGSTLMEGKSGRSLAKDSSGSLWPSRSGRTEECLRHGNRLAFLCPSPTTSAPNNQMFPPWISGTGQPSPSTYRLLLPLLAKELPLSLPCPPWALILRPLSDWGLPGEQQCHLAGAMPLKLLHHLIHSSENRWGGGSVPAACKAEWQQSEPVSTWVQGSSHLQSLLLEVFGPVKGWMYRCLYRRPQHPSARSLWWPVPWQQWNHPAEVKTRPTSMKKRCHYKTGAVCHLQLHQWAGPKGYP